MPKDENYLAELDFIIKRLNNHAPLENSETAGMVNSIITKLNNAVSPGMAGELARMLLDNKNLLNRLDKHVDDSDIAAGYGYPSDEIIDKASRIANKYSKRFPS